MRITIVQSEIEEAITDHIRRQITVNEGMEITIDLRATRGAEGFQADIDIHPKRSGGSGSSKKPAPAAPKGNTASSSSSSSDKAEKSDKPLKIEEAVSTAKASKGTKGTTPKPEAPKAPELKPDVPETPAAVLPEAETDIVIETSNDTPAEAPAEVETSKPLSLFAKKTESEEAPAPSERPASIFGGLKKPVNA